GKDFPESEAYYKRALSIPLYNGIMKKDAYRVVETLKALLEA
ncbi:MAG: UDP-4-amino-4,6-dideoxy-N-acetyl-beta-L-altrosamine transaminase, partial [Candidatus Omnitrophica bacterium]|nr:UDP-4-amino-4,6-dideoxy-N-acetyl-beta-L-altrosamine transaminase [Candidatus Omnitrophota bacterium]